MVFTLKPSGHTFDVAKTPTPLYNQNPFKTSPRWKRRCRKNFPLAGTDQLNSIPYQGPKPEQTQLRHPPALLAVAVVTLLRKWVLISDVCVNDELDTIMLMISISDSKGGCTRCHTMKIGLET